MSEWLNQGGGAQDALDDPLLHESFLTFLTLPTEQKLLESVSAVDSSESQALKVLDDTRKTLHMTFLSQTMRPSPRATSPPESNLSGPGLRSYGSELPVIDEVDAEELVNNLNSMASAAFRNVNQEVRSFPSKT